MLILPENKAVVPRFRGLSQEPHRSLDRALILGLTLLALALRMYKLGEWSFWEDEVFSIREINHTFGELFALESKTKHILFPLLQKLFRDQIPWAGEGSFRLLSVILGVISVPAVAVMGRSLVGRGAGLLAGLFMALCPWHIYWSQNNRYYTLTALLSLMACWLFWLGLRHRKGKTLLVLSFVPALLAIFSHPSAVFVLAATAGFMLRELVLARKRSDGGNRSLAILYLLILGLGVVLISPLLFDMIGGFHRAHTPNPLSHLLNTMVYYQGTFLLALALFSWWPLRQRAPDTADLLLCLTLVPLFCIAALGLFVRVTAQYLFFTYPFYCLLAGWGGWICLEGAWREGGRVIRSRLLSVLPALLIVLPYMAQGFLYYQHEHGWRPRWREAAKYVQRRWKTGDVVMVTNPTPVNYYLDERSISWPDLETWPQEYRPVLGLHSYNIAERVPLLLKRRERTWLIVHMPVLREIDPTLELWGRLKRQFRLEKIFQASTGPKDMNLYVLSRQPLRGTGS